MSAGGYSTRLEQSDSGLGRHLPALKFHLEDNLTLPLFREAHVFLLGVKDWEEGGGGQTKREIVGSYVCVCVQLLW